MVTWILFTVFKPGARFVRVSTAAILLMGLLPGVSTTALGYDSAQDERRARIGLRLFRTVLAADTVLGERCDTEGQLPILVVFNQNQQQAAALSEALLAAGRGPTRGRIKQWLLRTELLPMDELRSYQTRLPPAGIFVAEQLDDQRLQALLEYAETHGVMTYSPFEGDVERGVTAGLKIGARVLPYLNMRSLQRNQLQLNELLLRIASKYEP